MYLARTNNRINEAINTAYVGGSRQPPGANDGVTIGRIMVNELDAARIDPLLSWSVARAVGQSIDYIVSRSNSLVSQPLFSRSLRSIRLNLYHSWQEVFQQIRLLGRSQTVVRSSTHISSATYTSLSRTWNIPLTACRPRCRKF
jgi:hypothetical protein